MYIALRSSSCSAASAGAGGRSCSSASSRRSCSSSSAAVFGRGSQGTPRTAFKNNPWEECEVDLDFRGTSPMYGGKPVYEDDGSEIVQEAEKSFSKAHYEQHCAVTGTIRVGEERVLPWRVRLGGELG